VTAVIRVTGFAGTLTTAEPQKFTRWEWHDPHGLARLGPVFTPTAQALDAKVQQPRRQRSIRDEPLMGI
jgi:protein-L-isoaspartate(D-aspartate) O-methyltransferase